MRGRRLAALAAPLLLLGLVPASGRAQQLSACDGRVIRRIRIEPSGLFADESDQRLVSQVAQWLGRALSWRTAESTIRRELLFAEGDTCDERRLMETARLLRAQPYIRSAEIVTTSAPDGTVDVVVRTRDDLALDGSFRIDTDDGKLLLRSARITEDNLLGQGLLYQLRYDRLGRRAGLVVDVLHRQVINRTDAELVAGRTSIGPVGELSLRRGFESEFDRTAWRVDGRWREEPFALGSDSFGTVTQPLGSTGVNLGFARRTRAFGSSFIFGLGTSYERLFVDGTALASVPANDSAANAQLAGRFRERRRLATDLVLGFRDLRFVPRAGVDAVDAVQDLREGFEIRIIGGRSWGAGRGTQRDWFLLGDVYAGTELSPRLLAFVRGRAEGRYLDDATRGWDGVIAAADLYSYAQLGPRTIFAFDVRAAGGWHTSTPFQLMVSSQNGMRGYGMNTRPAGRRVVAQAEHRYLLGTVFRAADLGTTLFLDVGGGWAGDAAFARTTGLLAAVGAGIRVGFPNGSRVTTRLDIAAPLLHGQGLELRLTLRRPFGISGPDPDDVERSRLPISTLDPFQFTRY